MKNFLIFLGILYCASLGGSVAHAAPTHVQDCNNAATGSNATLTCTFGVAVTAGHQLIICGMDSNVSAFTLAVAGDTGTLVTDANFSLLGGSPWITCFWILKAGGGETVLTLSRSGGNLFYAKIVASEFSGATRLDIEDNGTATATSTSAASNSVITTKNGDLVIGVVFTTNASPTVTAGGSFTLGAVDTSAGVTGDLGLEYQVQGSAGSIASAFTLGSSTRWLSHVIAFVPQIGGSTVF